MKLAIYSIVALYYAFLFYVTYLGVAYYWSIPTYILLVMVWSLSLLMAVMVCGSIEGE